MVSLGEAHVGVVFDINIGEEVLFSPDSSTFFALYDRTVHDTGYRIQNTEYATEHTQVQTKIAKQAKTTQLEDTRRKKMDDETLIGSARSPYTSPHSTSTMMSPRTLVSGGTGNLGTGRRRPLHSLADVVSELKRNNDFHAGSSLLLLRRCWRHGGRNGSC